MASDQHQTAAQQSWPQRQFVDLLGKFTLPLIAIFLYSLVELILNGATGNHYVFMMVGSVLSTAGAIAYVLASYIYGAGGKKGYLGMLMAFSGFIGYVFGCYITFYQGLWGFAELSQGFSLWLVIKAVVAVVLGYSIVSLLYKITEVDKSTKMTGTRTPGQKLDDELAMHGSFESAVVVGSEEEAIAFIIEHENGELLTLKNHEMMQYKGNPFYVLHVHNKVTGQTRSVYFDASSFQHKG